MEQARSLCSAAVILTAALCYFAPSRPAPPPRPAPRPEAGSAAPKQQAKASRSRAEKDEDDDIRKLQQQLSWGRGRCPTGTTGGKHDANCPCQRRNGRPAVFGADGVFNPDMRAPQKSSAPLPRHLRREAR